jgi:hypothetical protein
MAKKPESASSEPFVSQQDRPNIHADTPLSELRVRDLQAILAHKTFDKTLDKSHFKDWTDNPKHVEKMHLKEVIDNEKWVKDVIKDIPGPPIPQLPGQGDALNQIAQSLVGLQSAVNQLANEVEQLKAKAARG